MEELITRQCILYL